MKEESESEISRNFSLSKLEVGQSIKLNKIYFERSKPVLLPESFEQLDILVSLLLENINIKIELAGHTDNQGDSKQNQVLSEERVSTIKAYMTEKGIAEDRITGKGYGDRKPFASNATEETRKLNRRVEFKIISN